MPNHNFDLPKGRLEYVTIDSAAVAHNMLGDPTRRTVGVYLPEGYDDSQESYPLMVGLAAFTGSGLKMLGWQSFGETLPQRIDRLVAAGKMGPVVMAFPDCFTSLGGNQYVNSPVMGNWEDFLLKEMLPELQQRYRVKPGPEHRAIFGHSSGGYGAIRQALLRSDEWGAVACHSGDMGFDLLLRRDLPVAVNTLATCGGDIPQFIERVRQADKISGGEMVTLMMLALAASYDPDANSPLGIRLPVDLHTCELLEDRWRSWLIFDPVVMLKDKGCQQSLRKINALYIDCGSRDEYFLHYAARAFVRQLEALKIDHQYEEFDDTHSGISYRLDRSLPVLYKAITDP
jgi:hypothetical protein